MAKKLTHEEFLANLLIKNEHYANGKFAIASQYLGKDKDIVCYCNVHNRTWRTTAASLNLGSGCPYCAGKRIIQGETDLWTVRPDIARLLKHPEDGYKYGKGVHNKVEFICPDCQSESTKGISDVCAYGFSCPFCSDGISFPNKFGRAFLQQLPICNLVCEYQPDWAKPYFYDSYFVYNDIEYIIEMDGEQHYVDRPHFHKTLYERQEIDRVKECLAAQHNIEIIRIDCTKAEYGYIKSKIIESRLSDIFDLSMIDWELCYRVSQNNMVKEACQLYASGILSVASISKQLHINRTTSRRYLQRGNELGWCDYDVDQTTDINGHKYKHQVALVDEHEVTLLEFDSVASCVSYIRSTYDVIIYKKAIVDSCKTLQPYKGFNFRFINET